MLQETLMSNEKTNKPKTKVESVSLVEVIIPQKSKEVCDVLLRALEVAREDEMVSVCVSMIRIDGLRYSNYSCPDRAIDADGLRNAVAFTYDHIGELKM